MTKRILLCTGLFLAGMLIGFELAWLLGLTKGKTATGARGIEDAITVTLAATIDGSERFIFTRDHVWNEHGQWDPPTKVTFNGLPWDDLSQPPPGWTELAQNLDLRAAKLATREGRDLIALEPTVEGFDLLFADTQMGAGKYAVTITIPKK